MLNRRKIAQCRHEGITVEKADSFAELGDASPLYRCVSRPLAISFYSIWCIFPDIYSKTVRITETPASGFMTALAFSIPRTWNC